MLNIVIPMAGAGSRFSAAGYKNPKPLIPVHGKPMIQVVIDNLRPVCSHRFIFICQEEHVETYGLKNKLSTWAPDSELIMIDGITEGAACTVLKARDLINTGEELMIANSDQYVDIDINSYLQKLSKENLDGLIMTMYANDTKWSYAVLGDDNLVKKVVEKEVVSNEATVGIYNFRQGKDFVEGAEKMIALDMRVNNEFYVAPVYDMLVEKKARIGIFNIGSVGNGMYGLGTPADLEYFLEQPVSTRC
ncbi:NTP transferase domain-containing protein [Candidatus Roizmanbacteria bacterium]|nr:NTP transferase domain-containing protein [Candidatus Roizmanbacteria bacterium]